MGARRMLVPHPEPRSGAEFATTRWWSEQRGAGDPSNLTFVTLNRMAELLLRSNPQIANALRATYPFIFVDEFQDTTFAQYDFLYSVFRGSSAVITGVGDDKQRIMGWAGARPDAFARLEADFHALRVPLLFNFRSSPDLVAIQPCRRTRPRPIVATGRCQDRQTYRRRRGPDLEQPDMRSRNAPSRDVVG